MLNKIKKNINSKFVLWSLFLNTGLFWTYYGMAGYHFNNNFYSVVVENALVILYTLLFWIIISLLNLNPKNSQWKEKKEIKNFIFTIFLSTACAFIFYPFFSIEDQIKNIVFIFFPAFFGATTWIFLKEKEKYKQEQDLKAKTQIDALQRRITPHFLFNSLNAISSMIRINPSIAENMCLDLADLCRLIVKINDNTINLNEEIDYVNKYIEIEKIRFGEKLEITINSEIKENGIMKVPPLIFQPLVENAITHGGYNQNNIKQIFIQYFFDGNTLYFEVENLFKENEKSNIGLSEGVNLTKERLKLIFKDKFVFETKKHKKGENYYWRTSIKIENQF